MSSQHAVSFWSIVGAALHYCTVMTSRSAFAKQYFLVPGFKDCFWMRLASHLRKNSLIWRPGYYLCRTILHRCSVRYGISIPYNTRIRPGLYIGHYGSIVAAARTDPSHFTLGSGLSVYLRGIPTVSGGVPGDLQHECGGQLRRQRRRRELLWCA